MFLSQVLGGGAAEEGAWSESPTVGGHLQVPLVEGDIAGNIAVHACNSLKCVYGVRLVPLLTKSRWPKNAMSNLGSTAVMSVQIFTHVFTHMYTYTHCI